MQESRASESLVVSQLEAIRGSGAGAEFLEALKESWGAVGGARETETEALSSWSPQVDPEYERLMELGAEEGLRVCRERLDASCGGVLPVGSRAGVLRDLIFWASFALYVRSEDHSGGAAALMFVEERTRLLSPSVLRVWCLVRCSFHVIHGVGGREAYESALLASSEAYALAVVLDDREWRGRASLLSSMSLMRLERWREAFLWWQVSRSTLTSKCWQAAAALSGANWALENPAPDPELAASLLAQLEGVEELQVKACRLHARGRLLQLHGDERGALADLERVFGMYIQHGHTRKAYLVLVEHLGPLLEGISAWSELAEYLAQTSPVFTRPDWGVWARGEAGRGEHHRLSLSVVKAFYTPSAAA